MDVYFGENYWGCEGERHRGSRGEPVFLETEFSLDGRNVRIPAVYVCEEGLAADICVRVPADETERFYKKWRPRLGTLSPEEEEQLSRENPLFLHYNILLRINGEMAEQESRCGVAWIPPYLRGDEATEGRPQTEESLMEAYHCDCTDTWYFSRQFFRWPEGEGAPPKSLCFIFEREPETYQGIHFSTRLGEEKKQVEFLHPVSGKKHVLTVQHQEQTVLPAEHMSELSGWGMEFERFPSHLLVMEYTIEPRLPMGELILCDCAEPDRPVMVKKRAAAVSVIGGADGPTSVFFAGKHRREHKNWQSICSSVHYEPVDTVEWKIRFHVKSGEKKEIEIIL